MDPPFRIALVAAPWPLFSRPSVQLGTLKAYLRTRFPEIGVDAHHFHLRLAGAVGYPVYKAVSERTWPAEAVYGALREPVRRKEIEALFRREARRAPALAGIDFKNLLAKVDAATDDFLDGVDWLGYAVVGFSVSLCQLTASLRLARRIKDRYPRLPILFGGATLAGSVGPDLFEAFPEMDGVVVGEGELPLARLVEHFRRHGPSAGLPDDIEGLATPGNAEGPVRFSQMADLSELPPPDYDDYFRSLASMGAASAFFPTLPLEISRGCHWRCADPEDGASGCAFCNLNLQWEGYRRKKTDQAAGEVERLCRRHRLLSVAYMDNALPPGEARPLCRVLAHKGMDLDLFGEIRPTTAGATLAAMARAGFTEVQIGIEALSTSLLGRLRKGTTAIDNLQIMKACEELGIKNNANLILNFPGSDDGHVTETLRAIDFAQPFRPLRAVAFWLGLESPVCRNPRRYGIRAVFNHPHYRALFGRSVSRRVRFMIQGYQGDLTRQRRRWAPVKSRLAEWKDRYGRLHEGPFRGPALGYRDGGDFLILRQRRPGAEPVNHRLTGDSRNIYLLCGRHRSVRGILDRFPHLTGERLLPFLRMMVDKRVMFEESGRYLSLAVPVRPGRPEGEEGAKAGEVVQKKNFSF